MFLFEAVNSKTIPNSKTGVLFIYYIPCYFEIKIKKCLVAILNGSIVFCFQAGKIGK